MHKNNAWLMKATHFILIVIAGFPFVHSRLPIGADTPRHSSIHLKPLLHHLYNIGESIFSTPISVCNYFPQLSVSNIDFYLPTLLRITKKYVLLILISAFCHILSGYCKYTQKIAAPCGYGDSSKV